MTILDDHDSLHDHDVHDDYDDHDNHDMNVQDAVLPATQSAAALQPASLDHSSFSSASFSWLLEGQCHPHFLFLSPCYSLCLFPSLDPPWLKIVHFPHGATIDHKHWYHL